MATSHYCNGTWRDGPVASCPRHKRLDRNAPSVYRNGDAAGDQKKTGAKGGSGSEGGGSGGSAKE